MEKLRTYFMALIPPLMWTLALSIGYTLIVYPLDSYLQPATTFGELFYYSKGLCLFFPICFLSYIGRRTRHLYQFLLCGIGMVFVVYFLSDCYTFTGICIILWGIQLASRLSHIRSILEVASGYILIIYILYFVITGNTNDVFLQKCTLIHFVISALCIFAYYGIKRFEFYITLRKSKAYMPTTRILNTGTSIFLGVLLIGLLVLVPLIHFQYQFTAFVTPVIEESELEILPEETQSTPEYEEAVLALDDLANESVTHPLLDTLWALFEWGMKLFVCGTILTLIYLGIRHMIREFRHNLTEDTDVIESTFSSFDTTFVLKNKTRIHELLDFSYEKKIRRQYKNTLRKYKPKSWQSPSEMEEMANLTIPELHQEYEKVRYSSR